MSFYSNKNPLAPFAPSRGYGFHQYINFGKKHKSKTFYDVATQGDFGYLHWCLDYDPNNKKSFKDFFISEQCFPHIRAALMTEKSKKPWFTEYSPPDQEGKLNLHYVSEDEKGQPIIGPEIEMKFCPSCNKIKNYMLFNVGTHDVCRICYTRNETIIDNKRNKYFSEVENKKGGASSYKMSYNNFKGNKAAAVPAYYENTQKENYPNNTRSLPKIERLEKVIEHPEFGEEENLNP